MKKPTYIAPRMYVREMVDGPDLERMLESGSYMIATVPKKPTDVTKRQRQFRNRRLEAGYRRFEVLLPAHIYELLHLLRHDGETMASLIARLASGNDAKLSMVDKNK